MYCSYWPKKCEDINCYGIHVCKDHFFRDACRFGQECKYVHTKKINGISKQQAKEIFYIRRNVENTTNGTTSLKKTVERSGTKSKQHKRKHDRRSGKSRVKTEPIRIKQRTISETNINICNESHENSHIEFPPGLTPKKSNGDPLGSNTALYIEFLPGLTTEKSNCDPSESMKFSDFIGEYADYVTRYEQKFYYEKMAEDFFVDTCFKLNVFPTEFDFEELFIVPQSNFSLFINK